MRRILTFPVVLIACYVAQTAAVIADACVADKFGGLVCGEGGSAVRVIADTTSPSKAYAFAWRTPRGLPSGQEIPEGVENVLLRLSDGAVLTKLGGQYWKTGDMRPNRYDQVVAALGGHGEYVERAADLAAAIERALASGKPACVNVMIESTAAPALRLPL